MKKIILIVILLFVLIFSKNAFAVLKINEIYPAPSIGEDEWVEIYNSSSSSADLSNYIFDDDSDFNSDSGNGTRISLSGILLENNICYWKFSNYLNNAGDQPTLFNNDGDLVDTYSYKNAQIGKSYSRIPDGGEWQINIDPTKASLNCLDLIPTPTSTPTLILTPTNSPTPTPIASPASPTGGPEPTAEAGTYDNIYLSEVMANPPTGENEWVEIYNDNDFSVSLNNWFIDDLENAGSTPKIFSLEIGAKSYTVFNLTSSMFNNDGDSVRLLDFSKNPKDDFEYQKTETGKTLGRIDINSDDFCLQEPSKNSTNNPCIDQTPATIKSITIAQTIISPAIKIASTKIIPNTKLIASIKPVSINQLIDTKTIKTRNLGQVLGTSDELIINHPDNKSLINLLSFLSFSYSLLTICSILFRMKLLYGKNKNLYSSSLHPS